MKQLLLNLACSLSLLLAGCGGPAPTWQLSQRSDGGMYQATLVCAEAPTVGAFQECSLHLYSQQALPSDLQVAIDGGMPAHGHGLPTTPQAIAAATAGEFRIEGLKYSMPGEWVLGFLLQAPNAQDKVVFRFNIP
ncbi:MAG: FixH family protein [Thiothrix sp.]